ncbi:MAG: hypothetical protein RL291_1541 [Pseudomonadota bacterium]
MRRYFGCGAPLCNAWGINMSPGQVRFIAVTSLGAIIAVAANALLLNGRSGDTGQNRPASQKQAQSKREPIVQRRGAFEPTALSADASLPHVPHAEGDPAIIRALKRALNERGYGPLNAEPTTGLLTRSAILAFEFDNGLPLNGEATEVLLARMASLSKPDATTRANLKAATPAAEAVVRHVQHKLHALGYLEGRIDGRLGDAMQTAIRRFEADQKLEPKGRIGVDVVTRLEAIAGKS